MNSLGSGLNETEILAHACCCEDSVARIGGFEFYFAGIKWLEQVNKNLICNF